MPEYSAEERREHVQWYSAHQALFERLSAAMQLQQRGVAVAYDADEDFVGGQVRVSYLPHTNTVQVSGDSKSRMEKLRRFLESQGFEVGEVENNAVAQVRPWVVTILGANPPV
jgi:hypothetical protein